MARVVQETQIGDFPFAGEAAAAVEAFQNWKNRLLDFAVDNPTEALLTLVLGSAWVFYLAERDENDGVNTYDDALYYISTCLCVGYANIFPKTQLGKLVAAIVMILGPSVSAWTLEGRLVRRTRDEEGAAATLDLGPVVEKLDAILTELRTSRGNSGGDFQPAHDAS
jgi:hypothetical protein